MRLLTRFLLVNLIENDNRSRRGETSIDETKLILDTFNMITASFMADPDSRLSRTEMAEGEADHPREG